VDASGSPYFTMKYLRGMSLSSVIRKLRRNDPETVERYTTARLLQVFIRICNAIEFAHSQGVCHLDLKPENVNIGDFGEVLVLDWGLACTTEEARKLSQSTGDKLKISGTPGYMAPEQIRRSASRPIGPLADIYALGGILHAMLVLNSPLHKLPLEEALRRTVSGDVPAPSEVAPVERYVPVALDAICRKAMAADPRQRYATVRELREDIFAFQTGYVPKAENASALKYAGLFIGRNLLIFFILLSLVLATALALAIYY